MAKWHEFYAEGFEAFQRGEIDLLIDTIKVAYMKNTYGFNQIGHVYWSDIQIDESVNASYPTGGYTISGFTMANTASPLIEKVDAADTTHTSVTFDNPDAVHYLVIMKWTGVASTSRLLSCVNLDEDMVVMAGAIWNVEGLYNGLVQLYSSTLPETISASNLTVSNITTGGYTATLASATSLTNTDYIQFSQDNTSDVANILADSSGTTIFTKAQVEAGIALVKTNASSTTKTLYISGVSNTYGRGTWSSKQVAIPTNQAPTVPTSLLEGAKSTTSVTITFTGSTDPDAGDYVERYRLYRHTSNTPADATLFLSNTGGTLGSPPSTTFNATGLTPGTTYYWWITAVDNNSNESAKSTVLTTVIPDNVPPSVATASIVINSPAAASPGTIDSATVAIGAVSNVDGSPGGLTQLYFAFLTASERTGRVAPDNAGWAAWWATIPSARKFNLVSTLGGGGDDTAITNIQASGTARTGLALTKDITYYPSVVVQEKRSDNLSTQWGSWCEASADGITPTTLTYSSPTCTFQTPAYSGEVAESASGANDGTLTAKLHTASGLQRNVTESKIFVGPNTAADQTDGNVQTFTSGAINIASATDFDHAVTTLINAGTSTLFGAGTWKIWAQVYDSLTGYGAVTSSPATVVIAAPTLSNAAVTSPSTTGYTLAIDSDKAAADHSEIQVHISTTSYNVATDQATITSAYGSATASYKESVTNSGNIASLINSTFAITESAIDAGTYYAYVRGKSQGLYGSWVKSSSFVVAAPAWHVAAVATGEGAYNPAITRSAGTWYNDSYTSYDYLGAHTGKIYANTASMYAEYTFTGTGIRYIGSKFNNLGKCRISIDGVDETPDIDQYNSTELKGQVLFEKTGLTDASHTIRVTVLNTKNVASSATWVIMQAFEYYGL